MFLASMNPSSLDRIEESEMDDSNYHGFAPEDSGLEQGDGQDSNASGQEHAPPTSFRVDWTGEPQSASGSTLGSGL
jgi:hypothetical protein